MTDNYDSHIHSPSLFYRENNLAMCQWLEIKCLNKFIQLYNLFNSTIVSTQLAGNKTWKYVAVSELFNFWTMVWNERN